MRISILLAIGFGFTTASAQFVPRNSPSVTANMNSAGDVNIIVKNELGAIESKALLLNANGTYTLQGTENVITPGRFADIKFGDIDGDGFMDAIYNGSSNADLGKGIAMNDGAGIFKRSTMDVTTATVSCGFADFDNNGLLDYYVVGNGLESIGTLFFQNSDGTFTIDQSSFAGLKLLDADITTVDFNNDGFIDMFVSGWDDNELHRYSAILLNDGTGKFTASAQPNLIRKGYGSSVWGDVDGDGWLDLLLNGDGGADGEASSDIYRLYRNNLGVLEPKATFNDYRQISVGDGARMVDWDNDGKLDIILTGWNATKARQATTLYICTNTSNFTFEENALSNTDFPGVSESSIETADLNNDGRIDLLLTGFSGNQTSQVGKYNRNICGYYLNQSVAINTKPSAVSNLAQVISNTGTQNSVALSWNPAIDDKTRQSSLTYNLSLKNISTGKWLINPMAVTSGTTNGWRRVAALGNMFMNRKWVLNNLPVGTYQWTVQAIDANFMGGPFAIAKIFSIAATGINDVVSGVTIGTSNGQLLVDNKSGNPMEIAVYSVTGSLLKQLHAAGGVSMSFNQGIYIVKVTDGTKTMVKKIVI